MLPLGMTNRFPGWKSAWKKARTAHGIQQSGGAHTLAVRWIRRQQATQQGFGLGGDLSEPLLKHRLGVHASPCSMHAGRALAD
jgi:hypothetical protein